MSTSSLRSQNVSQQQQGIRLQQFLREELHISSRQAKALLDGRGVFVNGKRVWMAKHALRKGDQVEWSALPLGEKKIAAEKLEILYRDPYLLAVNKPAGLVSDRNPKSVETLLRDQEGNPALRALHRLDRETSGLLMFLRSSEDREIYLDLFRNQEIQKVYQALLCGQPRQDQITVRKPIEGKSAETGFRILKRHGEFCKAECRIATGRKHQIRRHALELNCRVAGDRKYGQLPPATVLEKSLPRQMLHAFTVEFTCPRTKKKIRIHAPFADDFQSAVTKMKLD